MTWRRIKIRRHGQSMTWGRKIRSYGTILGNLDFCTDTIPKTRAKDTAWNWSHPRPKTRGAVPFLGRACASGCVPSAHGDCDSANCCLCCCCCCCAPEWEHLLLDLLDLLGVARTAALCAPEREPPSPTKKAPAAIKKVRSGGRPHRPGALPLAGRPSQTIIDHHKTITDRTGPS